MDGSSAGDGDGDQESQGFLSTLSFCDMMQVRLFLIASPWRESGSLEGETPFANHTEKGVFLYGP